MLACAVRVWKAGGEKGECNQLFDISMHCFSLHVCWCQSKVLDAPPDCLGPVKTASLDGNVWKGALDGYHDKNTKTVFEIH